MVRPSLVVAAVVLAIATVLAAGCVRPQPASSIPGEGLARGHAPGGPSPACWQRVKGHGISGYVRSETARGGTTLWFLDDAFRTIGFSVDKGTTVRIDGQGRSEDLGRFEQDDAVRVVFGGEAALRDRRQVDYMPLPE